MLQQQLLAALSGIRSIIASCVQCISLCLFFCVFTLCHSNMPKRKCSFTFALSVKYPFLEPTKFSWVVRCKICNAKFSVAHGGNSDIVQHQKTSKHRVASARFSYINNESNIPFGKSRNSTRQFFLISLLNGMSQNRIIYCSLIIKFRT